MTSKKTGNVISVLQLQGSRAMGDIVFSGVPSPQIGDARFSPSGRWATYIAAVRGRPELWVAPVADANQHRQVSRDGAFRAVWGRDGRELFYINGDNQMVVVSVKETSHEISFGSARRLFPAALGGLGDNLVDVTPDGRAFVLIEAVQTNPITSRWLIWHPK
jgi:hypothetical protein